MEGFRITEYDPCRAKSIADMWNRSTDSWGGSSIVRTEESILRDHENSSNITVFLAIDDDNEVIGYCSFSRYFNDTGALYIPLLNVRPDWHGRKVGKTLVLKAVEKTVEMGWPRLDLFTWPGNTKAVPTYKKCGFFWEKRDESTHLMNFIPTILQTDALKEYFNTADWYEDSRRSIEVKPDGRRENSFEYYEYSWEKDGRGLRVEFEKTSRGMSLIETDDYRIDAVIDNHELVAGRNYKVAYEVLNKSGKLLEIAIKGRNDKNIKFSMEAASFVEGSKVFEGDFNTEPISEDQNDWRTHPAVCADILINGKKAEFKTGLLLKKPAKLFLHVPWEEHYKNVELDCWLEIENNFSESAVFDIRISGTEMISFSKNKLEAALDPRERRLLHFKYTLNDFCSYTGVAAVKAQLENGETVSFETSLHSIFMGRTGAFGGEDDSSWYICNGEFAWHIWKAANRGIVSGHNNDDSNTTFGAPCLGRPYSNEFTTTKANKVEYYREAEAVIQEACYISADFEGLELISKAKLYPNGILEHSYTLNNLSDVETSEDVWFTESIFHDMYRSVLPYDGRFIGLNSSDEDSIGFWDSERLTENWIFSRSSGIPRGICWDKENKIKFDDHSMSFEYNFGRLPGKGCVSTEPVTLAYGTFVNWQDFRGYATKKMQFAKYKLTDSLDISVNKRNPFVKDGFEVDINEHKSTILYGTVTVSSEKGSFEKQTRRIEKDEKLDKVSLKVHFGRNFETELADFATDTDSYADKHSYILFKTGNNTVKSEMLMEDGVNILKADNGSIVLKAAADFSGKLHSMKFKGREWLDSSFPTPGPRSWWNPWTGGIGTKPSAIQNISIQQAPKTGMFTQIADNRGNIWIGIRINVLEQENDKLKGLEYNQYYLLLPGAHVVCHTVEVLQNTGRYFNYEGFDTECYFMPDEEIGKSSFKVKSYDGQLREYKSGSVQHEIKSTSSMLYGSNSKEGFLQVVSDNESSMLEGFSNREVTAAFIGSRLSGAHGTRHFTPPVFFIFSDGFIEDRCLKDLKGIRFGQGGAV